MVKKCEVHFDYGTTQLGLILSWWDEFAINSVCQERIDNVCFCEVCKFGFAAICNWPIQDIEF
jgi:hypothetical protein